MSMSTKKRVLVIGAGASGLPSIKACKEENFDVVCYEKTTDLGGVWRYRDNDEYGSPSMMKSTVTNSSKEMTAFSDFPPPKDFPNFMHHPVMLKYLELYAEEFELVSHIRYLHEVSQIIPADDYNDTGRWNVTVCDLSRNESRKEIFDAVMVCVGHHAFPSMPSYPGLELYSGQVLHSHDYKTFIGMEDKRVLVVGIGNSGTDIAVELSTIASKVYLSTRRGAWIFPRMMDKGKPIDIWLNRRSTRTQPKSFLSWNVERFLNSKMDHKRFGLKPQHKLLHQHPTISDGLQYRLISGTVILKPDVKEFNEAGVIFEKEEDLTQLDVVIFATGYETKFPFLKGDVIRVTNNKVYLYKNVFPPQLRHPSLGVIGLVQPTGGLFPVFEIQARWFASLASGKITLPTPGEILNDVRAVDDYRAKNYVHSPRYNIELPWIPYLDDIAGKIGAKPNLPRFFFTDPKLFWACFNGPCLPYQYRLNGPHAWGGARQAILTYKERVYAPLKSQKE